MFTGIIREIGILGRKETARETVSLEIECKKIKPLPGDSISVNGVCLTAAKTQKNKFCADVSPETIKRTNLGMLKTGARVNLEPSLKLKDAVSGHFVYGHIDACCQVIFRKKNGNSIDIKVKIPEYLLPFVAPKCSLAINGASITVNSIRSNCFTSTIVPFTQEHTNLGSIRPGDYVNIEIDMIARFLYNFTKSGPPTYVGGLINNVLL